MLDVSKRKFLESPTVGDIINILSEYPEDALFNCCGDDYVWIHAETDKSVINIDTDDLSEEYPEEDECL